MNIKKITLIFILVIIMSIGSVFCIWDYTEKVDIVNQSSNITLFEWSELPSIETNDGAINSNIINLFLKRLNNVNSSLPNDIKKGKEKEKVI